MKTTAIVTTVLALAAGDADDCEIIFTYDEDLAVYSRFRLFTT